MADTVIDKIHQDHIELLSYLDRNQEISFRTLVDDNFKKILALAAASYYEHEICRILREFITRGTNNNLLISSFVQSKGIERQYHTYFQWGDKNANQFFGLFGADFKRALQAEIKNDADLDAAVKAFLQIGHTRNQMVHENYGNFLLDMTAEEVYRLYVQASNFVSFLEIKLHASIPDRSEFST